MRTSAGVGKQHNLQPALGKRPHCLDCAFIWGLPVVQTAILVKQDALHIKEHAFVSAHRLQMRDVGLWDSSVTTPAVHVPFLNSTRTVMTDLVPVRKLLYTS
jgi:hypothetical protein